MSDEVTYRVEDLLKEFKRITIWPELESRMTLEGLKFVARWCHPNIGNTCRCLALGNTEEETLRAAICLEQEICENESLEAVERRARLEPELP